MNAADILIRAARLEEHIKGLREWRWQEMTALAEAIKERQKAVAAIRALTRAIDGQELELEFLKGVGKI